MNRRSSRARSGAATSGRWPACAGSSAAVRWSARGLFVLGIAFGLRTVATGGFDFFAGWLIAAYVLVVLTIGVNALPVVQRGFVPLTDMAVEADAGERPFEEVQREMAALRTPFAWVVAANILGFTLLIVDMVVKPFLMARP